MKIILEHANVCVKDIDAMMKFLKAVCPDFIIRGEGKSIKGKRWVHFGNHHDKLTRDAVQCELFGVDPGDELPQEAFFGSVHPDDLPEVRAVTERALHERGQFDAEFRIVRPDDETRWLAGKGIVVRDDGGKPVRLVGVNFDITNRKEAEAELRRLSKVFLDSADPIFIKDLDGRIVDLNSAAERQYGWPRAELLGQSIRKLVPAEEHAKRAELMERCLRGEEVRAQECSRLTRSGERWPMLLTLSRLTDDAGQPVGIATISEDITKRKQAEQALQESEQRLRAILEAVPDAIITISEDGVIRDFNPAATRMFGYSEAELSGASISLLMPSPHREQHDAFVRRYLTTGEATILGSSRELTARRKDGSVFPIELSVSEVGDLGIFTGTVRDVTRRKRLEKEILEIAAEEDRRIGQELHDHTQQELTGLGLMAQNLVDTLDRVAARTSAETESDDRDDIGHLCAVGTRLSDGLQQANKNVRMLSRGLIPVEVDSRGLMSALTELANSISLQLAVACEFFCDQPVEVANNFTATHLYRIAQESITNALKHGAPDRIEISLSERDNCVTLHVLDNGIGIVSRPFRNGGMGLGIMSHRAGLIGATLSVEAGPHGGTSVTCTVSPN